MLYLNNRLWRCYRLSGWSHKTNCSNSWTRQAALKQELTAKKQALQEAQRRQRDTLTRQIRRAQARLSAADRKRRTRRLILIGSYIEHTHAGRPSTSAHPAHGRASMASSSATRTGHCSTSRPKRLKEAQGGAP